MNSFHKSVLLQEVVSGLNVQKGKKYIDATVGGGGHTFEILKLGGEVLGIDMDQEAINYIESEIKNQKSPIRQAQGKKIKNWERLVLVKGNFRDIEEIAHLKGFDKVSGIIFDLGVSSYQLETVERGFSFQKEGPLDMRMDKDLSVNARDLVNGLTERELCLLFLKFGEEKDAKKIAKKIVAERLIKPIETTRDLVKIIEANSAFGFSRINKATRVFQALRIAVNDELEVLGKGLVGGLRLLEEKGRVLVISFHSLEDRIVKRSFLQFEKENAGKVVAKKPIRPTLKEIEANKRARSAKLRIFEKN